MTASTSLSSNSWPPIWNLGTWLGVVAGLFFFLEPPFLVSSTQSEVPRLLLIDSSGLFLKEKPLDDGDLGDPGGLEGRGGAVRGEHFGAAGLLKTKRRRRERRGFELSIRRQ